MTDNLGWVGMEVRPTFTTFKSRLESGTSRDAAVAGDRAGQTFGSRMGTKASSTLHEHFSSAAKYVVGPLVAAFAIEKVGELVKESIQGASDLQAAQNQVRLIFGKSGEEVDRFTENAVKSYGLGDLQARKAAAGFGILFKQTGLTREESARSSIQFTKLAGDLAAFNHTDPEQAFLALQRGLQGSTRGLKPYGVLIDSTAQKVEALQLGILKPVKDQAKIHAAQISVLNDQKAYNDAVAKSGASSLVAQTAQAKLGTAREAFNTATAGAIPALTAQQKVLTNQHLILQQTTTQQGAAGRAAGSLYGQQRRLTESWSNAKDALGKGLLPFERDLVTQINRHVIPAVRDASVWFEHKGAPAIHHFTHELEPLVHSALPAFKTGLHDAYGVAKELLPVAKGIFDSFNNLPGFAQKALIVGAGAGYLAKKSGLLGVGAKAVAGTVASKAEPIPVFVTNPGFSKDVPPVVPGKGGGPAADAEALAGDAGKVALFARLADLGVGVQIGKLLLTDIGVLKRASASISSNVTPAELKGSRIGGAPGVNIDYDRLSTSLRRYGDASKYALKIQDELRNPKTPYNGSDQANAALGALRDLREAMKKADQFLGTFKRDIGQQGQLLLGPLGLGAVGKYAGGFSKLPKGVQTAFFTPGLIQSQADVEHLQQKYNLTPKQVQTLFKLTGIDQARQQASALQTFLNNLTVPAIGPGPAHHTGSNPGSGSPHHTGGHTAPRAINITVQGHVDENGYVSGTAQHVYDDNRAFEEAHGIG